MVAAQQEPLTTLADPLRPKRMGRYRIFRAFAAGGLGTVHFARLSGPSGFARTVAAKCPHARFAGNPQFALTFIDEGRLAARIRHPNVVATLDVIQTATDLALVMDYVHGESVNHLVDAARSRGEKVPLQIAASILIDALHGLHAAHEAEEAGGPLGIIHRDVSPQNILVGADGIARLADFGVAKAVGRLQMVTVEGSVKGKYPYLAPEQLRGEPVSRVTDTYAAAIVFWELLTGQALFLGETEHETAQRCLYAPIPPPSQLVPDLSPRIDDLLRKALAREPSQRWPTAREMALEIEACVPAFRPSEVGAWVQRMVGPELAVRAASLVAIEQMDTSDGSPHEEGPDQTATAPIKVSLAVPDWVEPSAPSVVSQPSSGWRARLPATSRVAGRFAPWVLAVLLLTALAAEVAARHRAPATGDKAAVPLAPIAPVVAATANAPLSPAGATSILPAATSNAPVDGAVASRAPKPETTATGARPGPNARSPASRSAPPKSSAACQPPYWIDSLGRTRFKSECL
jgi:eukaryotic-like serine/threonine-protein kinase